MSLGQTTATDDSLVVSTANTDANLIEERAVEETASRQVESPPAAPEATEVALSHSPVTDAESSKETLMNEHLNDDQDSGYDLLNVIRILVDGKLQSGFESDQEIIDSVSAHLAQFFADDDLRSEVECVTRELSEQQQRRQARWEGKTDCERLDAAFTVLERQGIVARQNFGCCDNCGYAAMQHEIETVAAHGRSPKGFAFYHSETIALIQERGILVVNFGSTAEDYKADVKIGRAVIDALKKVGFKPVWCGSPKECITVSGVQWRRRRPERMRMPRNQAAA